MADTEHSASGSTAASGGTSEGDDALRSERGKTTIADGVVSRVAGIATREVGGVYALGGGTERAVGSVSKAVGMRQDPGQGVSVEVGESQAAVDLTVVIDYGESATDVAAPKIAEAIRKNVSERIEGITGLSVTEVNIAVNDLHLPGEDDEKVEQRVE